MFNLFEINRSVLRSCMLTVMGIAARTHHIDLDGAAISITKLMASNPRKVSEIIIEFKLPGKNYSDKEKVILEKAAITCPVALSLNPDIKQTIYFSY